MLKKNLKRASALVQAAAFSIMCLNGAVVTYAENVEIGTGFDDNIKPISIYMVETPSPSGEVAVKFVDEFGNEVDFDLIPDIDMADNYGSYYNLYDENRATSVKNQGQEGLCWAHAGMSSVESNLVTQNIEPLSVDLSEKHMAWFTNGVGPADINDPLYGDISNECGTGAYDEGGNIYGFTATLARGSGPVYESVVPYSTQTALSENLRYQSLYQLKDMTLFDPSDRTAIKKALVNNGVVYLNYCSSSTYLNNSSDGYCYYCPNAYQTNHAVSIVGWDDNFSKDNFKTAPEGDGAWIIKNSWGTSWGNNGLFYLSYYDATVKTVGTFTMGEVEDSLNIYQYDGNYKGGFSYPGYGISISNIFTSDSNELLEAISFWTRDAEVPYKISVYTDIPVGGDPTSGTLVHTQQGEMLYAGYHKIELTKGIDISEGCRYSIVVDLKKQSTAASCDSYSPSTGISFSAAYNLTNGNRYSWNDTGNENNFCLKAFTSETAGLPISSATFPDATFRQYVSNNFDKDKNGYFTQAELDAVTEINIAGTEAVPSSVTDLKGIKYFANLTKLDCSYNQITSLDISSNTALKNLDCSGNRLTTLDVTKNIALSSLVCSGNQLTSLDLSNNYDLNLFICANNRYSIGDVVGSYSLDNLPAGFNPNMVLDWTDATYNPTTNSINDFTSTAVSYNYNCGGGFSMVFTLAASSYKLDYVVKINEEAFPDATFRQYVADKFDKDNNGRLSQAELDAVTYINVSGTSAAPNTITSLTGIEYFTKLTRLDCSYNQLATLDVSNNTALKYLYCYNNQLTSLNIRNASSLIYLYCYNNQLTSLDLSDNTALTDFICNDNLLTNLNVSNNTALKSLSCYSNQLKSLNVSKLTNLASISCYNNQLSSLDVSDNTNLTSLSCYSNQLKSIDVSNNTALTSLNVKENQLTRLDVSKNTALTSLYCSYNQLTSLDVSNNTSLNSLSCLGNTYSIGNVIGSYSLNNLPAGFDPSKASSWSGATYDSANKSLTNFTKTTVSYTYDCGNGKSTTFKLVATSATENDVVDINDTTFPDATFRQYVFDNIDANNSGGLSQKEIDAVTLINVSGTSATPNTVSSLTGIGYFTKLKTLYCSDNQLTSIDVSKNTALTGLHCSNNQLASLDVSSNTALTYLSCSNNRLTSLDVSKNTALTSFYCTGNTYSIGNVIGSYSLDNLPADFNSANVTSWTGAAYDSATNSLTDFTKTTVSYTYDCGNGKSATFKLVADSVTAIDVVEINTTTFPDATFRQYVSDKIDKDNSGGLSQKEIDSVTSINVAGTSDTPNTVASLKGIEHFTKLTTLYCAYNQLTSLDVSSNTTLTYLSCSYNQLTSIDVSKNTALTSFYCTGNTYSIGNVNGSYSLDNLPADFNSANVTSWTGATYDSATNSLKDFTSTTVTYKYNCGYGDPVTFTLTATSIVAEDVVEINETNFPDATFRDYVINTINGGNTTLTVDTINSVTEIDVSGTSANPNTIEDLTGIEHFTKLTTLFCLNNQLTNLDVSKNTSLVILYCGNNQITNLDVSNNTKLAWMDCGNNQLASLDVSKNTALEKLWCSNNRLTSLNVSNNTALTSLQCAGNQLTSLDLSNNTNLTSLYCYSNTYSIGDVVGSYSLSNLPEGFDPAKASNWTDATYDSATNSLKDFTSTTVTYKYNCGYGDPVTFTLTATSIFAENVVEINETNFPDATFRQYVSDNFDKDNSGKLSQAELDAVTKIDVSGTYDKPNSITDLTGVEHFVKLTHLDFQFNQLTSLDVSKNTKLTYLNCGSNKLTSLDVSKNTALNTLYCFSNQLKSINLCNNTVLETLWCSNNPFTSLDLKENTALTWLLCTENQLTSLDVSRNTALTSLSCGYNQLTSLDVSKNTVLTELLCDNNQLTSLELDMNVALTRIDCSNNQLKSLDVRNNTALKTMRCYYNQLTSLDVSKNTCLTGLECGNNLLTRLDISNNKALTNLSCNVNQLTSLDVSNNTELTYLMCLANHLTSLDLSKNNNLTYVWCVNNFYSIGEVKGSYSLDNLPGNFNPEMASNWTGATYDSATNSLKNFTSTTVTYKYDCGYGDPVTFTLTVTSIVADDVVEINETNFPDATFRQYVSDKIDKDNSDGLSQKELDSVTTINVAGTSDTPNIVASLKGIEHFTKLTTLNCSYNQLTTLDVSKNTALTTLSCYNNQLTSLDVSNNTNLTTLYSFSNTYSIGEVKGSYSLDNLPAGFDPAKASSWTGATYDLATNSLTDFTGTTVSYTYDCGNGKTAVFNLAYTLVKIRSVTINSNSVIVAYSAYSFEKYSFDEVPEEIVDYMIKTDINLCIDFVNAFSETEEDSLMLTKAQMKAIEAVLAYDYGNA